MWFRKTIRNRRHRRPNVLDVKLRSGKARAGRTRAVTVLIGTTLATLFCLYLFWRAGEWALNRFVYENEAFAVRFVDIQTDGVIPRTQLRKWSGIKDGENLMALDLARVRRNLEWVPNVRSVSVERILPRTLRIRVTERRPVAQVNVPSPRPEGGLDVMVFQLDTEGCVMRRLDAGYVPASGNNSASDLPTLTGVSAGELKLGRRVESPRILAALAWLECYARSPMAGLVDVRRVDASEGGDLVVYTSRGSEITFPMHGYERRLLRWREIHDEGVRRNKQVLSLDLAVSNNVPVRWRDAEPLTQPAPRAQTPASLEKRNV